MTAASSASWNAYTIPFEASGVQPESRGLRDRSCQSRSAGSGPRTWLAWRTSRSGKTSEISSSPGADVRSSQCSDWSESESDTGALTGLASGGGAHRPIRPGDGARTLFGRRDERLDVAEEAEGERAQAAVSASASGIAFTRDGEGGFGLVSASASPQVGTLSTLCSEPWLERRGRRRGRRAGWGVIVAVAP